MSKKQRFNAIIKLINEKEIDTQEQLTAELVDMGFDVSQATVSRDINELNIIKGNGSEKKFKYVLSQKQDVIPEKIINMYRQATLSIINVYNQVVIKTITGNANTVCYAIDQMHIDKILGTIAGDDTILIITKNNQDAESIVKKLREL